MTNMEKSSNEQEERIIEIEIERLRPFKEHPFQVKDDKKRHLLEEMLSEWDGADKFIVVMDTLFEKLLAE